MNFFRYPGGKSRLRKQIFQPLNAILREHNIFEYREPFFGGGSIGLHFLKENLLFSPKAWINDLDIGVFCLWKSVWLYVDELCDRISDFQPSTEHFDEYKAFLLSVSLPTTHNEVVDIGFKKLAIHQISYSGLGTKSGGPQGGRKQKSKYTIDCRWSSRSLTTQIRQVHQLLNSFDLTVSCCDFMDLVRDAPKSVLLYLDPPYYQKGNDLYQLGFSSVDHQRLADVLRNADCSWVLSYDDCVEIRDLYSWATIREVDVRYTINQKNESTNHKKELIILNE